MTQGHQDDSKFTQTGQGIMIIKRCPAYPSPSLPICQLTRNFPVRLELASEAWTRNNGIRGSLSKFQRDSDPRHLRALVRGISGRDSWSPMISYVDI